jgi:hypothetical protein
MVRHPRLFLVLASALLTGGVLALGPGKGKQDSQISLVRPDDAPDDNAKGTLRIRHKGNADSFDVHIMKVTAGNEYHLWIEDPVDSETLIESYELDGDGGSQKLKLDTKKGDGLPLDALSLDELIGRRVEIRHGGNVVLLGIVPPFGLPKKPQKAKVDVDAPDGAPEPDMHGTLSLRSKANKGQERIDLKAKHVDFGDGPFHVFVEEDVDSDTFVAAGKLEKTDKHEGRWRRDTKKGQALPDGVFFVSELAGRLLEVRDDADIVYLRCTIPDLD